MGNVTRSGVRIPLLSRKKKNRIIVEPDELVARAQGIDFEEYLPKYIKRDSSLTSNQTDILNKHWHDILVPVEEKVGHNSTNSKGFHETFYDRLFELHPGLRELFGGDMEKQGNALVEMISEILFMLPASPNLLPELEKLAMRHVGYGAVPEHYSVVGEVLLYALGVCSSPDQWTTEIQDAWLSAYSIMMMAIIPTTIKIMESRSKTFS
mmetsp:Transcript_36642/g.46695  ORF Transcript_36642/g.46695 Transcript_36642/m.46695 type:complete len:209 (+) Transcript_36642:170-796(+)|eukprot:CAMPEP_0117749672 /NCGR_PEP_ID=MMETSP0947-20121206/9866_1 /TAXON_ID=44440 /ORGANISM="Chattonella subsalsa, Strain CCMP2191" /LENGTH=208 /DNA_ID=CAMNT_0005567601 /DNA_START=177 /DNA_END=803 /DNA_ORIENTATION=+